MDRTALFSRASEVRRRIFASLPWDVRFAAVLTQIAADTGYLRDLGRLLGAEMLQAGVEGMPDPGPKWDPNSPRAPFTLPNDYMGKFVHDIYGLLIKSFHNPDLAQEALVMYIGKLGREIKLKPVSLSTAESFIRHGIVLEARTLARKEQREHARQESIEDVDDDSKSLSRDLADPNSLNRFRHVLSPRMWKEWMAYLAETIHPDIPLYLELKMEGFSNEEILGVPKENIPSKLPHWKSSPQNWKNYGPKIIPKSVEFFQTKHEELPVAV